VENAVHDRVGSFANLHPEVTHGYCRACRSGGGFNTGYGQGYLRVRWTLRTGWL